MNDSIAELNSMLLMNCYEKYMDGKLTDIEVDAMKQAAKQLVGSRYECVVKPILDMDNDDAVPDSDE